MSQSVDQPMQTSDLKSNTYILREMNSAYFSQQSRTSPKVLHKFLKERMSKGKISISLNSTQNFKKKEVKKMNATPR